CVSFVTSRSRRSTADRVHAQDGRSLTELARAVTRLDVEQQPRNRVAARRWCRGFHGADHLVAVAAFPRGAAVMPADVLSGGVCEFGVGRLERPGVSARVVLFAQVDLRALCRHREIRLELARLERRRQVGQRGRLRQRGAGEAKYRDDRSVSDAWHEELLRCRNKRGFVGWVEPHPRRNPSMGFASLNPSYNNAGYKFTTPPCAWPE